MGQNKKEKALKRAKTYRVAKRISIVMLIVSAIGCLIGVYETVDFWSMCVPPICLLTGLILLFEQGLRNAVQTVNMIEYGFMRQTDSMETTETQFRQIEFMKESSRMTNEGSETFAPKNNKGKTPTTKYLTNMALITYSVVVLGLLVIGSTILFGTNLDAISDGLILFLLLVWTAAILGYIILAANMVYLFKKDPKATSKAKKVGHVILVLFVSSFVFGLSALGYENSVEMLESSYDLTFATIFWFSLSMASLTAPIVDLIASIKNRRVQSAKRKPSIERFYRAYMLSMKRRDPNVVVTDSLKGFLNRSGSSSMADMQSTQAKPTQKVPQALREDFDENLSLREQGRKFAREINKANDLIPDERITADLNIICKYVNDIYAQASKSQSIEQQIRKFNNIYLPKTLQLCNVYIELQNRSVETDKVKEVKVQISDSIANAKEAFAKFNDTLTQQSSLDIEAEIETFERILTIDGLLNRQEIVVPEEKKEEVGS